MCGGGGGGPDPLSPLKVISEECHTINVLIKSRSYVYLIELDLGPNCLQRLSADAKSLESVKEY